VKLGFQKALNADLMQEFERVPASLDVLWANHNSALKKPLPTRFDVADDEPLLCTTSQ
jgi:hypothetical protein